MRAIDADALIKWLDNYYDSEKFTVGHICNMVKDMPTIEERKRGAWIPQDHNKTNGMASTLVYYYPKCSVCGHCANYTNFCPNCGADMRKREGEKE